MFARSGLPCTALGLAFTCAGLGARTSDRKRSVDFYIRIIK